MRAPQGLILSLNSNAVTWEAPYGIEAADILAILLVLAFACLGGVFMPLQVAEYWVQQEAMAAFVARHPIIPKLVVAPLFDFAEHVRIINAIAGGMFAVSIELLLIKFQKPLARLVNAHFLPKMPRSALPSELRAIRQTLEHLAETRTVSQSRPDRVHENVIGLTPADLRASAERCFRLAQGAVGRSLAEELETLGRDFEEEARLLERRTDVT
jgi:hypothetical protein